MQLWSSSQYTEAEKISTAEICHLDHREQNRKYTTLILGAFWRYFAVLNTNIVLYETVQYCNVAVLSGRDLTGASEKWYT